MEPDLTYEEIIQIRYQLEQEAKNYGELIFVPAHSSFWDAVGEFTERKIKTW